MTHPRIATWLGRWREWVPDRQIVRVNVVTGTDAPHQPWRIKSPGSPLLTGLPWKPAERNPDGSFSVRFDVPEPL